VVALDVEGHGRSSGTSGLLPDLQVVASDIVSLLVQTRARFPGLPIFLMGNSMGGCSALLAALAAQRSSAHSHLLSGLVLQCPLIRFAKPPPQAFRVLVYVLARLLPAMPIPGGHMPGRGGSKDVLGASVLARMQRDELVYTGRLRLGTAMALDSGATSLAKSLHQLSIPFLVQHGSADALVAFSGSELLAERAASIDKQLLRYEGASHNLLSEEPMTLHAVRSDYLAWLDARAEASAMSAML
jgi:alpha-beta hydrolase superfamily lysophospholipase